MTWSARISEGVRPNRWQAEVLNDGGSVVARISGSSDYVWRLVTAVCERRSVDVRDLFQSRQPLLYCIHGGAQ